MLFKPFKGVYLANLDGDRHNPGLSSTNVGETKMNDAEQERTNNLTIIAADAYFKGELTFESSLHIKGRFEGKLTTTGELEIMPEAIVNADIEAKHIVVRGTIHGNLDASGGQIDLKKTANIRGDLKCEQLNMLEGASVEGHCQVGKGEM